MALLAGCHASSSGGAEAPKSADAEGRARGAASSIAPEAQAQTVPATLITPSGAASVPELLQRAEELTLQRRFEEAKVLTSQLFQAELSTSERARALFIRATIEDFQEEYQLALASYLEAARSSSLEVSQTAHVRAVRLLIHFEKFDDARREAAQIDPKSRAPLEQVLLLAADSLALVSGPDYLAAERPLARARSLIEDGGFDRGGRLPVDVAALYYALGELRRRKAEALVFEPLPKDFSATLEARCQHVLDAQSAYSTTMRADSAHWSAMAGVRVGQLYQRLHADLLAVPQADRSKSTGEQALIEGAMRLRYSILLTKAVRMMETTVEMLDRTGEASPWRQKATEALSELEGARTSEEAAIDALPYSREELKKALNDLHRAHGGVGQI